MRERGICPFARSLARALLRSASGPEVKGSAIRRGIGNYSPERGRASVTFITELSASLGKQCASFNPRFPVPAPRRSSSRERGAIRPASRDLPHSRSLSFSSSRPPPSPTRCTTAYLLLLASPLNGISVLSDGPRAELRPCGSFSLPLPFSPPFSRSLTRSFPRRRVMATFLSCSLSRPFLFRLIAEYIARVHRCALERARSRLQCATK